ncbi:DUF3987 domain-containing protein [Rhizobium sp. ICMP 5592]|uniref:DUF3987 domain-containing protein n=1 Tax=Rhizobium sp. ICMP 5592 TaxID=2292445 RepID=UPI001295F621|nr:DUF3987 domain-containing protein [Rhizobium sp. ICMP 5592]MQB43033.1 DUF3987 domain-containing protein [Rhizobium sp. ICMP 5592]
MVRIPQAEQGYANTENGRVDWSALMERNKQQPSTDLSAEWAVRGAEVMGEAARDLRAAKEADERMQLRKMTGQSVMFEFRKPRDVLRKVAPPPYEFDEVPPSIGTFAHHYARATGFDRSGVIVAAVTAAASVIDDRFKLIVRGESNWHVSARQWSFLCGGPSAGKSPVIRAASDHIKRMHGIVHERWRGENEGKPRNEQDPAPALFTSDTTVAALSERLQGNPRGLLMLTEEFASWVGAIDSGDRGDASKNRGDWLQLRDGGPHQIDRVERGSVFVPNWGVSVLAACTPDGLAKQMKQMPEDGLIQRFVPCILGAPDLDAKGDATQAMATWGQWLEWAYSKTSQNDDTYIHLSVDARALFDAEVRSLRELVIATEEFLPAYAAHLGKHSGMLAEVALVFHVFGQHSGNLGNEVGTQAMDYAIRYMRKVRRHAYTLYSSILSAAPAFELARALARSIVAAEEVLTTVARDWMTQHCQAFKKADDRLRREAVQILEDADWLEAQSGVRAYGGWPSKYSVHPQVFTMFAPEGEQWRARRAAVRDAIGETG